MGGAEGYDTGEAGGERRLVGFWDVLTDTGWEGKGIEEFEEGVAADTKDSC